MVIHKVVIVFISVPHFSVVVPLAGSVCMLLIIIRVKLYCFLFLHYVCGTFCVSGHLRRLLESGCYNNL